MNGYLGVWKNCLEVLLLWNEWTNDYCNTIVLTVKKVQYKIYVIITVIFMYIYVCFAIVLKSYFYQCLIKMWKSFKWFFRKRHFVCFFSFNSYQFSKRFTNSIATNLLSRIDIAYTCMQNFIEFGAFSWFRV